MIWLSVINVRICVKAPFNVSVTNVQFLLLSLYFTFEPTHVRMILVAFASGRDTDDPALLHRLSIAFANIMYWKCTAHFLILNEKIFFPASKIDCIIFAPGSVARLVIRRSRVRGSSPAIFFRWDWSWNLFYGHSLPSIDSRREAVSYL